MYLIVDLPTANMSLYRFQKIPVIIYEQHPTRVEVMKQREQLNKDKGQPRTDDKSSTADSTEPTFNAPKLNQFLTGIYVIGEIEYIYQPGLQGIKQRLKLFKREWAHPI